jgi:hypothetical protein
MKMRTPEEIQTHALRELKLGGMLDDSADHKTKNIASVITNLMTALQELEDPDGVTMKAAIGLFIMLVNMRLISPITDSEEEWANKTDLEKGIALWQNIRDPNLFSGDGGKTYYVLDDVANKRESKRLKQTIITEF